jgi:hypothetical protein
MHRKMSTHENPRLLRLKTKSRWYNSILTLSTLGNCVLIFINALVPPKSYLWRQNLTCDVLVSLVTSKSHLWRLSLTRDTEVSLIPCDLLSCNVFLCKIQIYTLPTHVTLNQERLGIGIKFCVQVFLKKKKNQKKFVVITSCMLRTMWYRSIYQVSSLASAN